MNKKIISTLLVLLLLLTVSGCSSKKNEEPKTDTSKTGQTQVKKEETALDKIKKAGKVIVGTEATFPPYESMDPKDGKTVIGFDIDIARAVAKKIGVEIEVKDTKFDGLIPALQAGTLDFVAAGMTVTPERAQNVDFSQVYYKGLQVLIVKDTDNTTKTGADMKDKKIGAQLGTTSEKAAQGVAGVVIKQYDKVDQEMLAVKNGMIDGAVVDDTVGVQYVKSIQGLKIVKVDDLNKGEAGMGIAVKKGNSDLLKVIDDTIKEMKSNGEFDKLIDKWGLLK